MSSSSSQQQNQLLTNHPYMIGDYMIPSGNVLQQQQSGSLLQPGSILSASSLLPASGNVLHYKAVGEL